MEREQQQPMAIIVCLCILLSNHSGFARMIEGMDIMDLRAETFSGRIRSELGGEFERRSGPGQSLEQRQGSGQVRIEARTFSGNITLSVLE